MRDFTTASLASALACVVATLAVAAHLYLDTPAPAAPQVLLAQPALPQQAEIPAPRVLSTADRLAYRHIFELQEQGDWKAADAMIARLENRILLGSVQAQRYLHKEYQTSPRELKLWLAKYSELPQANLIYPLAQRKGVKHALAPKKQPANHHAAGNTQPFERFGSTLVNRYLQDEPLRARLRSLLIEGKRSQALALLHTARRLPQRDYDLLRWYVASSFFNHGEYRQAGLLASASAARSGKDFPALHWIAGVSDWHLGNFPAAYRHFSAMAQSKNKLNNADASAAAFWAYRAADRLGDTAQATHYLQQAALHPDTFYGIQASKALERDLALNLTPPPLTKAELRHLLQRQPVRRIIALSEIDQRHEAEQELRSYYISARESEHPRLLSLAVLLDFPAAQIRMAMDLEKKGIPSLDYALYPTPDWQPRNGYAVDPALVFAIARQESGFNNSARSHAGASGVMQLMPETARYLLSRASFKGSVQDPAINIALGQQYIHHLQQQPAIGDNLVYLIAAYNAGPSPLIGWKRQMDYQNDPLLFVESIPFAETRSYVLHVLTNYWIYNEIIGNNNTSVHAMLAGKWPLYLASKQEIALSSDSLQHKNPSKNDL